MAPALVRVPQLLDKTGWSHKPFLGLQRYEDIPIQKTGKTHVIGALFEVQAVLGEQLKHGAGGNNL